MPSKNKTSSRLVPAEYRDAARGIRLQKAMAEAGIASRRDCETMIENGRVTVNGTPITALPAWVDPQHDRIELDGKALRKPPVPRSTHPSKRTGPSTKKSMEVIAAATVGKVYVMLHKPRQTITTTDDPDKRRHVMNLVPAHELPGSPRLFPVGRLDADSTGLLLLTNDGELANRLTHPRYGIRKTYLVSVKGRVETEHIEQLKSGLYLAQRSDEGRMTGRPSPKHPPRRSTRPQPVRTGDQSKPAPIKKVQVDQVNIVHRQHDRTLGDRTLLEVTLHEGHNRIIRRVLARVGLKVRRLQRTAIGPLKLHKLPIGQFRLLTPLEVKSLYQATGLK